MGDMRELVLELLATVTMASAREQCEKAEILGAGACGLCEQFVEHRIQKDPDLEPLCLPCQLGTAYTAGFMEGIQQGVKVATEGSGIVIRESMN